MAVFKHYPSLYLIGCAAFMLMNPTSVFSQAEFAKSDIFHGHGDVGKVSLPGSVVYDSSFQEYTISASGSNMWFDSDHFHFLWTKISGDFILRARMKFLGKGTMPLFMATD